MQVTLTIGGTQNGIHRHWIDLRWRWSVGPTGGPASLERGRHGGLGGLCLQDLQNVEDCSR